jgi:hypothetical protein
MGYLNSNLAREVVRLTGWKDKVWSRRYQAILISEEERAQVERLVYILSHGCKENLIGSLTEWPGVHAVSALLDGRPLEGTWFDRTREYTARLRGEEVGARSFAEPEVLSLERLPCWKDLSVEDYRKRIEDLVQQIEAEATAKRQATGIEPMGRDAILRQSPETRPAKSKKSPAPRFHAFTKRARRELYEAYAWFVAAFREAAEKLKAGDRNVSFPTGSFPPHLPFVRDLPPGLVPAG